MHDLECEVGLYPPRQTQLKLRKHAWNISSICINLKEAVISIYLKLASGYQGRSRQWLESSFFSTQSIMMGGHLSEYHSSEPPDGHLSLSEEDKKQSINRHPSHVNLCFSCGVFDLVWGYIPIELEPTYDTETAGNNGWWIAANVINKIYSTIIYTITVFFVVLAPPNGHEGGGGLLDDHLEKWL